MIINLLLFLNKKGLILYQTYHLNYGAGEGTRTHIPKAPDSKSGAYTNFATPA